MIVYDSDYFWWVMSHDDTPKGTTESSQNDLTFQAIWRLVKYENSSNWSFLFSSEWNFSPKISQILKSSSASFWRLWRLMMLMIFQVMFFFEQGSDSSQWKDSQTTSHQSRNLSKKFSWNEVAGAGAPMAAPPRTNPVSVEGLVFGQPMVL